MWLSPGTGDKGLHCSSYHPRERVYAVPLSSWWDPGFSVPGRSLEGFYYLGRWCDLCSSALILAPAAPMLEAAAGVLAAPHHHLPHHHIPRPGSAAPGLLGPGWTRGTPVGAVTTAMIPRHPPVCGLLSCGGACAACRPSAVIYSTARLH